MRETGGNAMFGFKDNEDNAFKEEEKMFNGGPRKQTTI